MTVGYGDIVAQSIGEKILCILLMIIGVIAFSFATGALSSIIQSQDMIEAKLNEKLSIVDQMHQEHKLSPDLYNRLVRLVKYDHMRQSKDAIKLMEELPHKLRFELSLEIHRKMYESINFFKGKDRSFIVWIATVLRPMNVPECEYIYKEAEEISESKLPSSIDCGLVFFMVEGSAAYVLPRYNNKIYVMLERGEYFGHVDMAIEQDMLALDVRFTTRDLKNHNMVRRFTVQAIENCDMFILRIDDVEKLKVEFPEIYKEIFQGANDRLKIELLLKLEVINKCEQAAQKNLDINQRFANAFRYADIE